MFTYSPVAIIGKLGRPPRVKSKSNSHRPPPLATAVLSMHRTKLQFADSSMDSRPRCDSPMDGKCPRPRPGARPKPQQQHDAHTPREPMADCTSILSSQYASSRLHMLQGSCRGAIHISLVVVEHLRLHSTLGMHPFRCPSLFLAHAHLRRAQAARRHLPQVEPACFRAVRTTRPALSLHGFARTCVPS